MLQLRRRWYVLAVAALACGLAAWLAARALLADLPDPAQPLRHAGTPSILITDRHGRALYEVIDPAGSKYRPLALAQIPLACQQATIATEDSRFYYHPGVDPIALLRAAWLNWRSGHTVSGGSTLTQQLARNLYLGRDERTERSLRRKLREAWLAWRLEWRYSKPEILALYLNTTFYGHFATGIEAAAQAYFGTDADALDLAQCALLAGLPQYPAGYNPIENPEAAAARQGVVLDLMVKAGYITPAQANEARQERLAFAGTPFPIEAPHFVMWVQNQLSALLPPAALQELNLAQGGLRVETTLDLDWQRQAEAIVARRLAQLRPCTAALAGATPGVDCDPQASGERMIDDAALVALDPESGAVRAMVGSADYFNPAISGAVNAALSLRQPGSAIKPLTYAAAFDPARAAAAGSQAWTPATLIADVRTVFLTAQDRAYAPVNYDMRYHGPVTARAALANSYNIPAVKTLEHIGVPALIDQANRQGINWLSVSPAAAEGQPAARPAANSAEAYGLALTLGGGEVRLLDLTAAYAVFANGGRRVTPYAITRVTTLDGKVLLEAGPGSGAAPAANRAVSGALSDPQPPAAVLDPRVAFLITDILSDQEARLPTFGPGNVLEIGRPAAVKTGTTTDWRDNWTVGYTPELVTGVWAGNADNSPMMDVSGVTGAGPIWHDFMVAVLRGAPVTPFARPAGLVQLEVCADSGLLPAAGDGLAPAAAASPAAAGSLRPPEVVPCPARKLEWFIAGTEPQQVDRMHERIGIDVRTGAAATEQTPPEAIHYETFWLLPDEYRDWARANDVPQPLAGAQAAAGGQAAASGGGARPAGQPGEVAQAPAPALSLASPEPNRVYRLDRVLPPEAQQLPVVARPGPELAAADGPIDLLVDGRLLAAVNGPDYTAWWRLDAGPHTFEAVAHTPDGREVRSAAVHVNVE